MLFENALNLMRKGYKLQRESQKKRLNAICLYMENGILMSEQTHELSKHRKEPLRTLFCNAMMADDWVIIE